MIGTNIWVAFLTAVTHILVCTSVVQSQVPTREKIIVRSSLDGTEQPNYLSIPEGMTKRMPGVPEPPVLTPLVVSLHSWSADLEQRQPELEILIHDCHWVCLQPNFRGINDHPEALASAVAQQDILDAVDWVLANYPIDSKRVYLTGNSGGGHMTMMMAARFPQRWRAASAWVGISDLKKWHDKHQETNYGVMLRKCCGGKPSESAAVDEQYRLRSPLTFIEGAKSVPLDLAAGIHDGHKGSVPIDQSLTAFNVIAAANGDAQISATEREQLARPDGRLAKPLPSDVGFDSTFDRKFYLRRISRDCRVTIFEGGHEGIATAAIAWFEAHP